MKDLFVLVADKYMEETLSTILGRHASIGIRPIDFEVCRLFSHDSGCYRDSCGLLKTQVDSFQHALTVFDYEGCGVENRMQPLEIEQKLNDELTKDWNDGAKAIVIVPELEKWIWSRSPSFASSLKWRDRVDVWTWSQNYFPFDNNGKPERPKEALNAAMRKAGTPKSTSIYKEIARKVSFRNCQDAAFNRMLDYLRNWFPLT